MGLYVLVLCGLLIVLVSVIKQWKLLLLLVLLFAASAAVLLWYSMSEKGGGSGNIPAEKEIESVHILYGTEKKGLLKDPEFQEILRKKHGIVIKGTKADGFEISESDIQGIDGIWPSTDIAALFFKKQHPDAQYKTGNIFHTPVVFYSWPEVTDTLIRQGIVEKRKNLYAVTNMKKLLEMGNRTWESLRLSGQNGLIIIQSPDPGKSNAGFLMAGLTAAVLNNENIEGHLSEIQKIYKRMKPLEPSPDTLFNRYIKQGRWAFPLISACENQIIEFYHAFPNYQNKIRTQVRVLIPEPTVLSEHPFLALTKKGESLLTALQSPDIQKLAWQRFGFRSGVEGIDNDPGELEKIGLTGQIRSLISLPSPQVMDEIIAILEKNDENKE
ncbi:hypothetical protein [Desulfonema magnum]|uniref:Extracellular solute-binding protein n=1 Tax=Desulfonema magnum TaxID=45655 RepID=A0A975BV37_9BACT|nr:hypothetical protein [Desulfonema magnum]QTA91897.1 Uncharacterized protein dnm_079710 [Desulfonema magnum]